MEWDGTTLQLERLDASSTDGDLRASARGALDTAGEQLAYRLYAEAESELAEFPPVQATIALAGDADGLRVDTLAAQLLDGVVEGYGQIVWRGTESADFHLSFAGIDPGAMLPDWPGNLSGELSVEGSPASAAGLDIRLAGLRGELRSLPLVGAGELNAGEQELTLRELQLTLGAATLEARGSLDEASVMLAAKLNAPELQRLDERARGSLVADLRLAGPRELPRVNIEASGQRLRWQLNRLRSFSIAAALDPSGEDTSHVTAEFLGFATAPGPSADLRLEASGTPSEHDAAISLERRRPEQDLVLELRGGLEDALWNGALGQLVFRDAGEEIWALQAPAALSVSPERVSLTEACMVGTLGLMCLDGSWLRGGPWQGTATLAQLDFEPLSNWLDTGLLASGMATGVVAVDADAAGFQSLTGGIAVTGGELRLTDDEGEPLITWEGGALALEGDASAARMTLRLVFPGVDQVEGALSIGWNEDDPPLEGSIDVRLSDLQIISELFPELSQLEGEAVAGGDIGGTLGAPVLNANFEWTEGAAQLTLLGIRLEDIDVYASFSESVLSFAAKGRTGEGDFAADGRFQLGGEAINGRATLKGDNLLLVNLPEARLSASPDLRLHYFENTLRISGSVDIPAARISALGGASAVRTSPDEVIIYPGATVHEESLEVVSRIRVSVGPDVRIQAAGLRGGIEGSILTVTEPNALPWGQGELRVVDGTFSVFGQRLEIETGRLIYTGGPLENPGLEIRAVRRVDTVTAGALVRGTLQHPEISVYSDPPMPRADALSYLMLGKGLDQLQSGEQSTVNQAANSLALSGGGLIAQDLGRRVGLDDVSVEADDDSGSAALVVSKYLGGGLYVSYGIGLFDTINTVRLRFQINPRLSIEATSGEESAADIFYTFERD